MRPCGASSSLRRRGPAGGSGQGHTATREHRSHLLMPVCEAEDTMLQPRRVGRRAGGGRPGTRGPGGVARGCRLGAEGVPELQQAGADVAQVIRAESFLSDRLPCVVREYLVVVGGRFEVIHAGQGCPLGAVI